MPSLTTSKDIKTREAGDAADLLCPRCGSDLLHQFNATFYDRPEDGPATIETQVAAGKVAMQVADSTTSRNPSASRDGMSIRFFCGSCGGTEPDDIIELTLGQHKSTTEIGWRFTPRQKP